MDPITAVGIGATVAGGGVSAIGSILSGNAKSQMYQYQSGIAQMNERIAKQDASYARYVGETEAQTSGMKTRFVLGKQLTAQSGSGLDVNSGSASRVRESTHDIGLHDEAVIRSNAAKRAYGFEVEAANASAQGEIYKSAAGEAKTAGYMGAASSVLGTVSSVSSKWLQAKQMGMFS